MPRGHEHISFVFSSAFWDIFANGKKDPCAVFGCNNDRLIIKDFTIHYTITITIQTRRKGLFSHYNLTLRKL